MFLNEPQPTPWDVHFQLFGIRVRISPFFWLGTALLGLGFAQGVAKDLASNISVGMGLLMWVGVVLISIIAHEFGHVFAFRYYGIDADVVLYQFGGLAVPRSSMGFGRQVRLASKEQIVISAAGPAASLAVGIGFAAILYVGGFAMVNPIPVLHQLDFLRGGRMPPASVWYLSQAVLFVNIGWAIMNLLPVYPLDGGHISRELFLISNYQTGIRYSLILSIATGAGVALWAFSKHDNYLGIMFAMLAYSSYQSLQAYSGRGGFGGGW